VQRRRLIGLVFWVESRRTEERSKQEEGVRGRKEGVGQALKREPECPGKQKRCQYMIALLRFYSIQGKRGGDPVRNWDPRIETSDRRPRATWDFRGRGQPTPNKPNRFKFLWVNQIDGFRPKQNQAVYLPCCQLDTTKFAPLFRKNER
jgi:hypothetical protein